MKTLKDKIVVLIANQRSGTNLLRDVLEVSGQFFNVGEIFLGKFAEEDAVTPPGFPFDFEAVSFFRYRARRFAENPKLSLPNPANCRTLFTDYFTFVVETIPSDRRLVLDIKYNSTGHFDTAWRHPYECPNLIRLLREASIPIIHLRRENALHVVISEVVSTTLGRWVWRSDESIPLGQPMMLDPLQIEHRVRDHLWE